MKDCLETKKPEIHGKDAAANTVVCVFFFFLTVILPLYFKNGYERIATRKSMLFRWGGTICGILLLLIFLWKMCEVIRLKRKPKGSILDLFVFSWAVINLLSYLFSIDRSEALYGTTGWYMGLVTQEICVLSFFGVGRFFPVRQITGRILLGLSCACAAFVFLWGLLNRFSIYPLKMGFATPEFISSIGNINWTGGYYAVLMPVITGAYFLQDEILQKRKLLQLFTDLAMIITLSFGIVEGSDDVYTSMALTFFLYLLLCGEKKERMLRWCELVVSTCLGCQIMRGIAAIWPGSLNYESTFTRLYLSNVTLIPGILALIGYLWLRFWKKEERAKLVFRLFSQGLIILSLAALIVYVSLLICNTLWPGSAGIFSDLGELTFNDRWGNARGATWSDGVKIWETFDTKRKLVGAGPDCFAAYAYSREDVSILLRSQFGDARLTNAHNEVFTILVNQGLLGVAAFLGMVTAGIREGYQGIRSGKDPTAALFLTGMLSAFVYNQFSFEQIMITPYFYLMLGLISAYTRAGKAELEEIPQSL